MEVIYNLKVKQIKNGNTLNFTLPTSSNSDVFVITNAKGLTENSVNLASSQGVSQDGTTIHGTSTQAREIIIDGVIMGSSTENRKFMLDTIVPNEELEVIYDNKIFVKGYANLTPVIERKPRNANFQFSIYAAYPYWIELAEVLTAIVGIVPMFEFPINYWDTYFEDPLTHYFGFSDEATYRNVYNYGNVPAKFKVLFLAKTTLTNPSITLLNRTTPNPYLKIYKTMEPGEIITIDMTVSPPTVISEKGIFKEDIFNSLDYQSSVFLLNPGDNLIQQDADTVPESLEARIIWNATFAGAFGDDETYL